MSLYLRKAYWDAPTYGLWRLENSLQKQQREKQVPIRQVKDYDRLLLKMSLTTKERHPGLKMFTWEPMLGGQNTNMMIDTTSMN